MPLNFVIGELNGFHGTMVNEKSIKYYYIIDGKAKVIINDEITDVEKGDFVGSSQDVRSKLFKVLSELQSSISKLQIRVKR